MNSRDRESLDRYITGNYGEDQYKRAMSKPIRAESKTPAENSPSVGNTPLRLKFKRQDIYEENARLLGKALQPHEGFPRENNGDWILLEENGKRFGTVTFKSHAKRGEAWNAPDPEGQICAEFIVRAVNHHAELLNALDLLYAELANGGYDHYDCMKQAKRLLQELKGAV